MQLLQEKGNAAVIRTTSSVAERAHKFEKEMIINSGKENKWIDFLTVLDIAGRMIAVKCTEGAKNKP